MGPATTRQCEVEGNLHANVNELLLGACSAICLSLLGSLLLGTGQFQKAKSNLHLLLQGQVLDSKRRNR